MSARVHEEPAGTLVTGARVVVDIERLATALASDDIAPRDPSVWHVAHGAASAARSRARHLRVDVDMGMSRGRVVGGSGLVGGWSDGG